ncbi:hypothetical protein ACJW31_10G028700 [Castanea mollissima]
MSSTRSGRHRRPSSSSSSVSSNSLLKSIKEPPRNFFPSKDEFLRLVAVLAIASSVAVCCNVFFTLINRQPKPFCDSHNSHSPDSISDFCEPCPSNGECNQGELECVRGYRKHGKLCVEDGDINETAKKLLKWIEIHLCEAQAQFLCDGLGAVWVREDDIWNELDGHDLVKNVGLDDGTFLYTKQRAMDAVSRLLETRTDPHGIKELKCPDLLAEYYKPVACRIRQWLSEHALIGFPVSTLLIGCTVLFWKVRQRRYISSRVEELYHQVEELVQEDSRVDRYPKLVKGESKVVWEWQVEGSLSSSKVRKKVEANRLKPTEGIGINSDQLRCTLKAEPKALIF